MPKPPRTKRYAHRHLSVGRALAPQAMPPNDATNYRNQLGPNTPQNQKQQNSIRGVVNSEKGQKRANRDIARQGVNFENVLPVWEQLQFHSVQQLRKTEMLKFNWFYCALVHNMKWMCTKPRETVYENTHAQHKEFRSQRALPKTLPRPKESRGH